MHSSTSNSKRAASIPWALILAGAVVLLIETILGLNGYPPLDTSETLYGRNEVPSMEESVVQWQVAHAFASTDSIDIVIIGDSSCLMGVRPRIIEETIGLKTINVGTVATLYTDGHADILEEFIELRGAPRTVVYHTSAIYGVGFYSKDDINEIGLLRQYRLWRGVRPEGVAYTIPSIRHFRKSARDRLPSLFIDRDRQQGFLEAKRGPYPSDVEMKAMVERLNGGMIEPEQWDWTQQSGARHSLHYNTGIFPGMRRFVALAEQHGFELIIAFNPMPEAYRSPDFEAAYADYIAAFQSELPAGGPLHYLEPTLRYYANHLCGTVCHLNDTGATENSKQIADWLSRNVPAMTDL